MIYSKKAHMFVGKTVSWNSLEEVRGRNGAKDFARVRLSGKVLAALDDYTFLISEENSGRQYKVEIYEII